MRVPGLWRMQRRWSRMTAPVRSQVAILMYHRIFETTIDPWDLCVSPTHFEEHLQYLRQHYSVMSLQTLMRSLSDGRLPYRAVVLTFDDGYVDNLLNARPLLEQYDVPATVFVSTGYVDEDREFWWDELERLLLVNPNVPEQIALSINGTVCHWDLSEGSKSSADSLQGVRERVYSGLHQLLRPLSQDQRDPIMETLRFQIQGGEGGRPEYRAMTSQEVCQIAEGGLMDVGSHTHTHPVLSAHPEDVQRWEMFESKKRLEAMLGRPVTTFCYPYGEAGITTPRLAAEAGFSGACATVKGSVTSAADPYKLSRFRALDWDGEEMGRQLHEFFRG